MKFLYLILLLSAGAAFAQSEVSMETPMTEFPEKVAYRLGAGYQVRIERQPGNMDKTESLSSPSIFAQVEYRQYQLHTELEQVSSSSSEGNYSIQTKRQELLLIGRYRFLLDERWSLFAGLGGGFGRETVETTVANSSAKNTGDTEKLIAAEGGAQFQFHKTYFAEVSGRGLKLENFEPWIVTFGLRLGARL